MNNGHTVPTTEDAEEEESGNINMIGRTWIDDAHKEASDIVQSPRHNTVEVSTQEGQHQQQSKSIDSTVADIDTKNSVGQSNNANALGRRYDESKEQNVGLGNLDQMRDALPDISK